MLASALLALLAPCAVLASQTASSHLSPVVALADGRSFAGNATLPGVVFYGGLPYAKPPVADLRWRAPVALEPVHGGQAPVVDARNWGPLCIQQPAVHGIGQEGMREPPSLFALPSR